jgi:hypothetical protein
MSITYLGHVQQFGVEIGTLGIAVGDLVVVVVADFVVVVGAFVVVVVEDFVVVMGDLVVVVVTGELVEGDLVVVVGDLVVVVVAGDLVVVVEPQSILHRLHVDPAGRTTPQGQFVGTGGQVVADTFVVVGADTFVVVGVPCMHWH